MSQFQVYALNSKGDIIEREIDAASIHEVEIMLESAHLDIISIKKKYDFHLFLNTKKFDLALFAQELETLLSAGISLVETLETLKERQQEHPQNFLVLSNLVSNLKEGQSFSSALKNYPHIFPQLFIASISSSEYTGEIVENIKRYIRYDEQVKIIKKTIVNASIYPVLLFTVGLGVAVFLLCYLVPRFSHVYEGMENLPFASKLLMNWGILLNQHASMIMSAMFFIVIILIIIFKKINLKRILILLCTKNKIINKYYHLAQLSKFYRALGLLLQGGIPIITALTMSKALLPNELNQNVLNTIESIQKGNNLTHSLHTSSLTTPVALRLLHAGEKNGKVSDMLEKISLFHDKEITSWIEKFTKLFEPLLMLIIGLVIGGIVILLYLPIFELAGNLS